MLHAVSASELQYEVEQLLYEEAALLDERDLRPWLDLFTDDARYAVFFRETVQPHDLSSARLSAPEIELFDDDKQFLEQRVRRLETRLAHAEQPPSFTRHVVSNVRVKAASAEECTAWVNFIVYQTRLDLSQNVFFGRREDMLRVVDGQRRIARRKVVLDASIVARAITIFF